MVVQICTQTNVEEIPPLVMNLRFALFHRNVVYIYSLISVNKKKVTNATAALIVFSPFILKSLHKKIDSFINKYIINIMQPAVLQSEKIKVSFYDVINKESLVKKWNKNFITSIYLTLFI